MTVRRDDPALHGEHLGDGATVQRIELGPRRRQQETASVGEVVERRLRGHPVGFVGLGVVTVGALPLREGTDEEERVVATGPFFLRRHPVGPRPQQIGPQHQLLGAQELPERQRLVLQRRALLPVHRGVVDEQVRIVGRPGEQHTGLLERLPRRRAHQRLGELEVHPEPIGPPLPVRSVPGDVGVAVAVVDTAAGKHHHPGHEVHRRVPAHQKDLNAFGEACGLVPDQHHRRSRPRSQGFGHVRLRCAARIRVRRAK